MPSVRLSRLSTVRRSFSNKLRLPHLLGRDQRRRAPVELILHIGTKKTGTTSFQHSIDAAAAFLDDAGVHAFDSPLSQVRSWAHEVSLAVTRPTLNLEVKRIFPEFASPERSRILRAHIATQVGTDHESVIISQEALSLLRTDEELEDLRELLLGQAERRTRIVVTLRETASYLTSMKGQLHRAGLLEENPARDSISYLEPDSWLVDHEAMIAVYERHFGKGSVVVVPYEQALVRHGSIVPAMWEACGIGHLLPHSGDLWLNTSPTTESE